MSENNNVLTDGKNIMIINGGNALRDCPTNWDEAKKWIEQANGENERYEHPTWSFDCGFKLDFDGGLLSISSRFYPPKTHSGESWDGRVTVYLLGKEVEKKAFDCDTLELLKASVESYISELKNRVLNSGFISSDT